MNILNENVSKKIVIIAISIIVVVALSLSTTYSLIYNTKKLSKNTYTTGILDIQYMEGEALELKNYIPMNDETGIITEPYTITITNTGTLTYKFDLSILSTVEDISKIIDAQYIRLQIDNKDPISLSELTNGIIYNNLILDSKESLEITIKMWLSEDTPNSQIGHIYSAKLVATGIAMQRKEHQLHSTSIAYQTLVKLGLDKYVETTSDSGILETNDDVGYLYYFNGNIDYNYVQFNEKYYRIFMIDSNGNIKMIYSGDIAHINNEDNTQNKDTIIATEKFNINNKTKQSNGYTYFDENIKETDSNVKIILEKWYEDNILRKDIESEIVDTIYCNDKQESQDNNDYPEENTIIYNKYNRILENTPPTLSCTPADSYTISTTTGNGSLKYPVGLITVDELQLIGNGYIYNNIPFWTMTSAKYENNIAYNFSYSNKIALSKTDEQLGIRPVLTIKTDNLVGKGTKEEPFKIDNISEPKEVE